MRPWLGRLGVCKWRVSTLAQNPCTPRSGFMLRDLEVRGRCIDFSGSFLPASMLNAEVAVVAFLRQRKGDHATGETLSRRDRLPGDEIMGGLKGVMFSF